MVGKSNVILLIPTGEDPKYPSNLMLLWDDKKMTHVAKIKLYE